MTFGDIILFLRGEKTLTFSLFYFLFEGKATDAFSILSFLGLFIISLNTESRLIVDFTEDAPIRKVELLKGHAHFYVISDPRPFEVFAGDRRILALGTSFDVKLDTKSGVMITLVEGNLAVEKANIKTGTLKRVSAKKNELTRLKAGEQLIIAPNARPIILAADFDPVLSWQDIN